MLRSLNETFEVVRLVPLQEQNLIDNVVIGLAASGGVAEVVEKTRTLSFFSGRCPVYRLVTRFCVQ